MRAVISETVKTRKTAIITDDIVDRLYGKSRRRFT